MLRGMQKATSTWLGRAVLAVLFGLIAISFAIWGIGDIFRGFGRSTAAKVGNTEITIEQFRQNYNERLQQLARRVGRPITRRPGARAQSAEPDARPDDRGSRARRECAPDASGIVGCRNRQAHHDRPDLPRADRPIRPQPFRADHPASRLQRRPLRRRAAPHHVAPGDRGNDRGRPDRSANRDRRFNTASATKSARSTISRSIARRPATIPAPSPEALNKYFEERKVLFRAPEYRKLDLLVLSPQDTSRWTEVSDADARKAYEDRRTRYVTPERREVQQIVFPNAEEARAAAREDRQRRDLRADRGRARRQGYRHQSRHGDESRDARQRRRRCRLQPCARQGQRAGHRPFRHGASARRQDRTGKSPALRRGRERDQARGRAERAKAQIADQHIKVEDERGAGQPLAEIAKKLNLAIAPHRGDRPFGPRSERHDRHRNSRPASIFSRPLSRPKSASRMSRCRRRMAAMSGSRWLARRRRANVRCPKCRIASSSAGARTRSPRA